ncbi:unnamed protein product [Linum trigynum]|uniref:Major facilitator superfamily (MFS) profile domain-containing protein n=1 Tax=Linum trigynum TaxID=586398 RepID=A0AAV2ETX9_9ROSI
MLSSSPQPLFPQSARDDETPPPPGDINGAVSVDEFLRLNFQSFTIRQLIQAILVSVPHFFDGQQTFISLFADAPTPQTQRACSTATAANHRSHATTTVTEWGLDCGTTSSLVAGLPASSFFAGCLVGGFFLPALSDTWLGRKKLLFLSCFGMSVAALATAFSPNVWVYSALRLAAGVCRSSISTCVPVLLTECAGSRWRGRAAIVGFLAFSLGLLSLPGIAYANRSSSWRLLYIWTSTPSIIFCILSYPFVTESPRWLLLRGHRDQAADVLTTLSSPFTLRRSKTCSHNIPEDPTTNNIAAASSSVKQLLGRRWARQRLAVVAVLALGTGLQFFVLLLGVGNLHHLSLYLGVALNGLLDVPAYALTFLLIETRGRRPVLLASCLASGLCSLAYVAVGGEVGVVKVVVELGALFCVCMAFNVLVIYTMELFPTSVRNTAAAVGRQAIMVGAVISPLLVAGGRRAGELASYGVAGVVVVLCGLGVVWLPETKGLAISDTLDEQENRENNVGA